MIDEPRNQQALIILTPIDTKNPNKSVRYQMVKSINGIQIKKY